MSLTSESVAPLLLCDNSSISVRREIKKDRNTWQLSHIIREEEPDVSRVHDGKLMRSSMYAVTVLSQLDSEWFGALAGDFSL